MQVKKHLTDAQRLHAALAETEPSSIDLILVRPAGYLPAFRLAALPHAPGSAACAPAGPAMRHGGHQRDLAPAWRKRFVVPSKSTVSPV